MIRLEFPYAKVTSNFNVVIIAHKIREPRWRNLCMGTGMGMEK